MFSYLSKDFNSLQYIGNDKCMLENFYASENKLMLRLCFPALKFYNRLSALYVRNCLFTAKQIIIIAVPLVWKTNSVN